MDPNDILAAIAVEINAAEAAAAQCGLALARGEALATAEFDAHFDAHAVQAAGVLHKQCQGTIVKLKARLAALHASLNDAAATADFPRPRTGK